MMGEMIFSRPALGRERERERERGCEGHVIWIFLKKKLTIFLLILK